MIRVIVRLKNMKEVDDLKKYGSIVFKSPILNMAALEMKESKLINIRGDENILNIEIESQGELMPS